MAEPRAARAAANRLLAAYLLTVGLVCWGGYLVFVAFGPGRIGPERLLIANLALVVGVSAFFIHRRTLRYALRSQLMARDLLGSRVELVERLASAAEYRDDATGLHNRRIGLYAQAVARRMGLDDAACGLIGHAAVLHDLGKIGVPDAILLKPGPLSPSERATMERHTTIGGSLLAGSRDPLLTMAQRIALAHHESWDGSGYPRRLAGEAIPLEARIVAICDVFDALTSARPYKGAWSPEDALAEIRRLSGTKLDPSVVAAFFVGEPEVRAILDEPAETL